MASMVASRRIQLARAMEKLLAARSAPGTGPVLRPVAVAGGLRGYNSGAPLRRYEREESEDDARRGAARDVAVPGFFSDVFRDPFSAPQSLVRLLSLMDDVASPVSPVSRAVAPPRRGWSAKEDEEALHLRVDMPGLGKEHVKVWAEQNSLVIKGEGDKDSVEEDGAAAPRYSGRVDLAGDVYRMDQIKAEMKNGVLRVVVPKVKEEQRRDVFQVNVD
ncbi:24.1 kDa heat shock protein, mitochondrial-like isoform X2 [Lolium rigidum]|uniref:24.1 kDa heat shock protein, mitochondrial-like isoform X2 n=1 Tax=Lolium rigidum TaxID=89674 RepID=UPI001F5D47BF|nr:24.1 kDa heat shock protein, mitochondrial-like isoform X2 [Lolium rigidum]